MIKNCETCAHWRPSEVYLTNLFGKKGTATDHGRHFAKCARFQMFVVIALKYYCGRNLKFWEPATEGTEN
jgi:hypothetical protein